MQTEDRAFQDYRTRPGPDTLRALLSAHQSTVYTLCFQVLRRAHDAEDAAQDALLEIIRGLGGLREPRAFKRWLCRVTLHTALDHLRLRNRRTRHEETRAAMSPLPRDPAAEAVHDALARLDDDDRCLIVEKFFERATLEEIGARDGVSAAAVAKRVDRAKERLKQKLTRAGLASVVPGVDAILEASIPTGLTPDLVSLSAALKSAVALAGGAVLGAKTVAPTVAVGLVVLMLLIGGGVVASRQKNAPAASPGLAVGTPRETSAKPTPVVDPSSAPPFKGPAVAEAAAIPTRPGELVERLERIKGWMQEDRPAPKTAGDFDRWFSEAKREADGLRDLILAHPRAFLDWLARPENSPIASNLVAVTVAGKKTQWDTPSQEFGSLPRELTDGLLEWSHGPDLYLQVAFLQLSLTLKDAPASYRERYLAQLPGADPLIRELAAKALLTTGELSPAEAGGIAAYLETVEDFRARSHLVQSIGKVNKPEVRDWLLATLESGRFDDPAGRLTYAGLEYWLEHSPGPAFEDRAGRILGAALRRVDDAQGYFYLVLGAVSLPLKDARALLAQAASGAPSEQLRRAAAAMLARPDDELKDTTTRRGAWLDAYWKK